MGGSRRKYKKSRIHKVKVGLPKKNPKIVKPAFNLPPKLRALIDPLGTKWDEQGSVISNYKQFGVVSNPNLLSVRSRTSHMIESDSLQVPPPRPDNPADAKVDEFEPVDSGSDLEEDDLKSALGKKRRDGKKVPSQPLTTMQRAHLLPLIEKYGDDYERMFRDTKLNSMQHSVATLKNLCQRYYQWKDTNPLITGKLA
ncbi:nucleolar protein 16-like [Chenopodium quinoa]|uniref:nucleolar protein 16-like n=1 Tax=Chenopodium quinoa TaxID=63459 RepID=UPI000B796DB6|nr:nucleolar protein 16-like [Chenopodium quinoa]